MADRNAAEQVIATNRKAFFNYEVLERAEAGISLVGTEVKSIREGGLNFRDSYVEFRGGELFLVGCRIGPYSHGNIQNHAEDRDRKLLLHKREILKLGGKATEKGLTIVPLQGLLQERAGSRSRSASPAARRPTTSASPSSARTSSARPARPSANAGATSGGSTRRLRRERSPLRGGP